jgi:Rrf2 family protein
VGKLLQTLVKQDIIKSLKGPTGGFYISKAQRNQPIINIVEAIDGKEIFKECGLGLSQCSAKHPCPIHNGYKEVRESLEKLFREKNVLSLCEPVNNGLAYLIG